MKLFNHIFIFVLLLCFSPTAWGEVESNVVIPELTHVFTFQENKDDPGKVAKVKHAERYVYTARRVPEKVTAYTFYNNAVSIDKAKSKGVIPVYESATGGYIFHNDSRVCKLPLSLEPGKNVVAEFETTCNKPGFDADLLIVEPYPVQKFTVKYVMPAGLKDRIQIIERNFPSTAKVARSFSPDGKEYILTYELTDIEPIKAEVLCPTAYEICPMLQTVGYFSGVEELYDYLHSYSIGARGEDPAIGEVERFARELTADCRTDMEKMAKIQDWVRENIRYVAIETGDLGIQPDLPSEVMKKRFGDCKGSANLIKTMLRAVDIDGRLVWIGTDYIPFDFTDVPNPGTGNHQIAAAIMNDSIYYIDGTVGVATHNYYSPAIQGKQTIIENGATPIIHRVPVMRPEDSLDSVTVVAAIVDNMVVGTIKESLSGIFKSVLSNSYRMSEEKKKRDVLLNFLTEGRKNFSFAEVKVADLSPSAEFATITGAVKIDKAMVKSGNTMYLNPNLYPSMKDLKINMKERKLPVVLSSTSKMVRDMQLILPEQYELEKLPENFSLENDFMKAELEYEKDSNMIKCRFVLIVKQREIPFESLPKYNEDITLINKALSQRIQLAMPQNSAE